MKHPLLVYLVLCLWCWAPLAQLRAVPLSVFLGGSPPAASGGTSPGTSDLVAWYNLDNANDSSGNLRTMTASGSVAYVAGLVGNCLELDSTEYLSRADSGWPWPADDFTVAVWIKPSDGQPAGSGGIFSQWLTAGNQRAWTIYQGTTGVITFGVSGDGTAQILAQSSTVLPNGAQTTPNNGWTFVVGVFTASTSAKLYINGALEDTETTSIPSRVHNSTTTIALGVFVGTGYYVGQIDSPGFWERALTDDEITWLYNSGAGRAYADL